MGPVTLPTASRSPTQEDEPRTYAGDPELHPARRRGRENERRGAVHSRLSLEDVEVVDATDPEGEPVLACAVARRASDQETGQRPVGCRGGGLGARDGSHRRDKVARDGLSNAKARSRSTHQPWPGTIVNSPAVVRAMSNRGSTPSWRSPLTTCQRDAVVASSKESDSEARGTATEPAVPAATSADASAARETRETIRRSKSPAGRNRRYFPRIRV